MIELNQSSFETPPTPSKAGGKFNEILLMYCSADTHEQLVRAFATHSTTPYRVHRVIQSSMKSDPDVPNDCSISERSIMRWQQNLSEWVQANDWPSEWLES